MILSKWISHKKFIDILHVLGIQNFLESKFLLPKVPFLLRFDYISQGFDYRTYLYCQMCLLYWEANICRTALPNLICPGWLFSKNIYNLYIPCESLRGSLRHNKSLRNVLFYKTALFFIWPALKHYGKYYVKCVTK